MSKMKRRAFLVSLFGIASCDLAATALAEEPANMTTGSLPFNRGSNDDLLVIKSREW